MWYSTSILGSWNSHWILGGALLIRTWHWYKSPPNETLLECSGFVHLSLQPSLAIASIGWFSQAFNKINHHIPELVQEGNNDVTTKCSFQLPHPISIVTGHGGGGALTIHIYIIIHIYIYIHIHTYMPPDFKHINANVHYLVEAATSPSGPFSR